MKPPGRLLAGATISLLCLIWGTTWSVIAIGLEGVPPMSGVALRFTIAAAILLLICFAVRVPLGRARHERALWVVNGLFSFVISYGVTYWAEQWVPSGLAAVLFAMYPLFVALLAHVALPAERFRPTELLGIAGGFLGVGVIFSSDFNDLGGRQVAVASVVMLASPLAAAIGSVSVKRWGREVHPLSITAVPMAMTAAMTGVFALATERSREFDWNLTTIGALFYLAIFGSAVTFSLYFWLLRHLPATRLSLIAYVIPVVAVMIGLLRGEPMTPNALVGSGLVVGGVALAVHRR
ncbi:MAG: EamA family transporter [bacterium]|nr:EamA family transporter [bacterium]